MTALAWPLAVVIIAILAFIVAMRHVDKGRERFASRAEHLKLAAALADVVEGARKELDETHGRLEKLEALQTVSGQERAKPMGLRRGGP